MSNFMQLFLNFTAGRATLVFKYFSSSSHDSLKLVSSINLRRSTGRDTELNIYFNVSNL